MEKYNSDNYPKTKEQYWKLVDDYWDDLSNIILQFHPGYKNKHEMPITAFNAEAACKAIREEIAVKSLCQDLSPLEQAQKYKDERSDKIVTLFNQAWFGIPESTCCWNIPSFGLLCDLCSESYVLEEELSDTIEGVL